MSEKNYPTPHILAEPKDFAPTVLMPGDPLRAKFIAETFIENAVLVNNVRGVQGYTGTYKGERVSVMASGMGIPSIGIYSYELYTVFGVENIIRIGSAGAIREDIQIRDIVFGMGASTNSAFADQYKIPGTVAPIADYTLLQTAIGEAEALGARYHVGNLLSSDTFYSDDRDEVASWRKMGTMAIEMEAAGLYLTAMRCGKRALAMCSISDQILTGERLDADSRRTSFTQMMEIALNTAIKMNKSK